METERLGKLAGSAARGGEVLALSGDLGTGKTCFVRGLAAGLGASRSAVSSPTFVFIHEYRGRLRLAHADLFRLESASACRDLGLSDYLNERSVVAVEWPEKAEGELPWDRLDIQLIHKGKTVRELRFQAHGTDSVAFLTRLRELASPTAQESCFAQPARPTRRADPK